MAEETQKDSFKAIFNLKSIAVQVLLFLAAAAALAAFYLSYRPGDFIQAFIVTGMILTGPWLFISLLPAFLVLEDRELRREIAGGQLVLVIVVLLLLFGLAYFVDFHQAIIASVIKYALAAFSIVTIYVSLLATYLKMAVEAVISLITDTLIPFFSRFIE